MKSNRIIRNQTLTSGWVIAVAWFISMAAVLAQSPDGFNPGANYSVSSLAVQPDGKILVGGDFSTLGGQPRNNLGRLNADGTLDVSFNPGASGSVSSLAVQADGKILVGGRFDTLSGQTRDRIGRLNADGTLDLAFNPEANNEVSVLLVQADGKILVGGEFTTLSGQTRNYLGRLNADSTLDPSFNPGANYSVYSLVMQEDGKILVGGEFTTLSGQTRNYLGRLNADGILDLSFNPGASYYVNALAVQVNGKILVGGYFTTLGGQPRNYLACLNADGTLDASFNPVASGSVSSLAAQADGRILVGGSFTTLGGQTRNRLGRLNADGTLDTSLNPGANGIVSALAVQVDGKILVGGEFTTLDGQTRNHLGRLNNTGPAPQSLSYDGSTITWLRGGTSPEVWRTRFEFSTNTGVSWSDLGPGVRVLGGWQLTGVSVPSNANFRARGFLTGGKSNGSGGLVETIMGSPILVSQPQNLTNNAGTVASFSACGGGSEPLNYQWLKNGASLTDGGSISGAQTPILTVNNALGADAAAYSLILSNAYGSVTSRLGTLTVVDPLITTQPTGTSANPGQNAAFSVGATGTAPLSFQWLRGGIPVAGATTPVLTLTNVQALDDASAYSVVVSNVWGSVTSAVAKLTVPDPFNPEVGGDVVYTLAVQADGKILVGGVFTALGGQPRNRIGRLNADGTLDTSFNPGANNYVHSLVVQADGKILVGGYFTVLGGQTRNYLGRLNADGTLDTSFNPEVNNTVYSLVVEADGRILVAGYFAPLDGPTPDFLRRLNADGALDVSFNPGANNWVQSLAVQADGKILVGGTFTVLGGQPRNRIGRLNADGTPDASFNPGADYSVHSLAVQTDGKIVVGGHFTTLGGQMRKYIGQLDSHGALDASFDPGANDWVNCVAVQADGRILVGGNFWILGGQIRSHLGRLNSTGPATQSLNYDGSTLTWLRGGTSPEVWRTTFESSTNGGASWGGLGVGIRVPGGWQLTGVDVPMNANVRARGFSIGGQNSGSGWFMETITGPPILMSQPQSRTNNAGTVATFSGTVVGTEPYSYQWLRNGLNLSNGATVSGAQTPSLTFSNVLAADAAGYSVVITNAYGSVTTLVASLTVVDPLITTQPVSKTANAGQNAVFSVGAAGTAPLNYQWLKGGIPIPGGTGASLTLTNLQAEDAGSTFSVVVSNMWGSETSTVAVLSVNLATFDGFNPGANGDVYSLMVQTDGKILVAGDFTVLGGQPRNRLGRVNADGTLDTSFNPSPNNSVLPLVVQADGKILVGGSFTMLGGQLHIRLGRLNADGTLDTSFNPGANNEVTALAVQADGKILVGGSFTTLGGLPRNALGRLNADGGLDTSFNPGANNEVTALAVQAEGKILVGGYFTTLGGQPRNALGRLNADGTLDTSFNPGAGSSMSSLAVQADRRILVGGSFRMLGGQPRNYLGRLNADGTLDTSFNPGANNEVRALAVQADGKILVGGNFTTLGGQPRNYVGRLNPDGTLDTQFNPGVNNWVYSLAVQADGKILVGGHFTRLDGQPRNRLGRLNNTGPATQSLSSDGSAITWLRGGTSPELTRTTFTITTNGGASWSDLGGGVRVAGGWQLTAVSVPSNATVRARGHFTSGNHNSSGGILESIWPATPPAILVGDVTFGFASGFFGFNLSGSAGSTVFMEGSTDLVHWAPLSTNLLPSGPLRFSDPAWTNFPQRFYRAVLGP